MQNDQTNPYLSSNFAPIADELDVNNLKVIGEIPKELCGIYMRNGPNPAFPPISYTYPFDGDGMIHAIYLKDGQAAYSNRYIETKGLIKERKAGKALYGGLLKLTPLDPEWAEPDDQPIAIKNGAIIHIIRHAGDYIALSEGAPAYKMTSKLNTLGEWNPLKTDKPIEVCAHTRLDPLTGELWFINYGIMSPFLSIYCFDKEGKLTKKWDIDKPYSTMIHDFVLTENYVIIFDCPTVLDIKKLMRGGSVLNWQPELGSRIGIMSRHNGNIRWLQTDSFFVFHFANAYETENNIIIDYVRHEKLGILSDGDSAFKLPPRLYRTTVNLHNDMVKHTAVDERRIEFPRIREDRDSLTHQFIYTLTKTPTIQNSAAFNAIIKYDMRTQQSCLHDFGAFAEIGEAVFAPSSTGNDEDDGYLMLFVYDNRTKQSEFVILNAANFTNSPIARLVLPRRVPNGIHGSWMPGNWE